MLADSAVVTPSLAAIVKDQIVAKGARRVAVTTLPDIAPFPAFNQLPAANTAILGQLATAFNTGLTTGLAGVDVRYIDGQALFQGLIKGGGFANVTAGACDPAKIAVITGNRITDGSSLACNASAGQPFNGMKATASASTWLFADGVHPSTGGHKAIGDYVIAKIKEWGWIPSNL